MDTLRGLFGGGSAPAAGADSPGLLADWQSYSGQDVEAGGAPGAPAGGQLTQAAEDIGSSIGSFFRSGYSAVSDGLGNLQASTSSSLESS